MTSVLHLPLMTYKLWFLDLNNAIHARKIIECLYEDAWCQVQLSLVEARTLPVGHCRVIKDLPGPARIKTNFEQNFFASKNMWLDWASFRA